jgi:dihydroorotate dehydrogenase electron transfer subunit
LSLKAMQQIPAHVLSVSIYDPLPGIFHLRLTAPTLASGVPPGQFLLASSEFEYARRPLFPIAIEEQVLGVLFPWDSPLRALAPGDVVDCIGPLGKGFSLPALAQNLLLLAQSEGFGVGEQQNGVTFLLTLIDQALAANKRVLLVHEAPAASQLFPPAALPPSVEVRLVTSDGSHGHAGSALDLLPELAQWADQVYATGHPQWYVDLVAVLREHRLHVSEGLVWGLMAPEIMPCGMGVCGGCVVETQRGYRTPCTDGPVFDLTTV